MMQPTNLPLVSIITPTYNGAAYIEELILSVKSQDYPHIEHILIDDGSRDDGATVSILQHYPHIRWWSRTNRGQYATMNEGLYAASGEYICFISADDFMVGNAVRLAIDWLSNHTGFDGVYGLTSYVTEHGEPFPIRYPFRRASLRYYPYFTQIQHCSLFVSRQTLLQNNLTLDPGIRFVGDYDWILRMINSGIRIGFVDATLSTIRVHENQMSAQNRAMMSKEQSEIANRNGFGGFRFMFYITILHGMNFVEQIRFAFKKNQFTGVKDFLHDWIRNKLLPYLAKKS
jgi:glycosyltransferase involved in cell wall biosynthesis